MAYSDEEKSQHSVGGLIAAAGGFGVSQITGPIFLFPLGIGLLALFLLHKFRSSTSHENQLAASLIGQLGWFSIGALLMPAQAMDVLPDIAIGLALLAWLIIAAHWIPAALIIIVQLFGLIINIGVLSQIGFEHQISGAMITHVILRAIIILAAARFLYVRFSAPQGATLE